MNKQGRYFIVLLLFTILPTYSQNIVNISQSAQELKNGIILFNDKQYANAIQAFNLALSYEPQNHAARYRLGLAYLYAGYIQSAIDNWEQLVNDGVADYQVKEKLNSLYFQISKDSTYIYDEPYIFRRYYNGLTEGMHSILRTSFITYDSNADRKFISSTGANAVIEMDSANKVIQTYGKRFLRPNILEMPTGTALYSNQLYVADFKKNSINIFNRNLQANFVTNFGTDQLLGPMGITFSDDGYLYIVDNGNGNIKKYQPDGTYISSFGDQELFRPTDIITYNNNIFVSDISRENQGRIIEFDPFGNAIRTIGSNFLQQPRGLFLDGDDLYISDASGTQYIYNLVLNSSRSMSVADDKLQYPFDMIKDADSIIWRTDFNSHNIAIYTPLQGVYGNLDLSISQIFTDQYPYIYALVRARNKDGSPLTEISSEEISLFEFDQKIRKVTSSGTDTARSNMLTHLVIDRSKSSEQYLPQLELYLKSFLSNFTTSDLVQVSLVDNTVMQTERIPADILKIWEFVTNHQPVSEVATIWDVPIYNSIISLFNNLRNRSIVVFTTGNGEGNAFTTYGSDILKTFADRNSIPLYVINFTDNNQNFWQTITTSSHGMYYNANRDAKEILNLYQTIKNAPPLEYLIEYEGLNYSDTPGLWIDLTLNLNRFGGNGITTTGYFVPTPEKPGVNIQEELFK